MTETPSETYAQLLSFTDFEVLKAIGRKEIVMRPSKHGSWKNADRVIVTSTVQSLIRRGLAAADLTYVNGICRPTITQAGYAAMSRAARHKPTKRGR